MGFEVGEIFHIVHTCADVRAVDPWYRRTLGAVEAAPMTYLDIERRWAVFVNVAGVVLEPMSVDPLDQGARPTPIQRFVANFGYRWHSLAYYVDGLPALFNRLSEAGVRMFKTGGGAITEEHLPATSGAIWTHPRDTFGLIEFAGVRPTRHQQPEPFEGEGSTTTASSLGIRGLACVTYVPRDLDAARHLYETVLGATVVGERHWDWYGTDSIYLQFGKSTVVELARPFTDQSRAAADLDNGGDVLHAVTFAVDNVGVIARHLSTNGINVEQHGGDLVVSPADTFGAVFRFTERPPKD
ncbi:MAG: VOC family protein [Dehalococcoidia bacterium]